MNNGFQAVFAITAIAMVAIGAIGLMQIGQEEIESPGFILDSTDTKEIENAGWVGGGSAGVLDGEKREVFTRTAYILSHRGNGQSQDITVQGRVQIIPPGLFECVLDDARYILSLSKDGIVYEEWQRFKFQLPTAALQAGQWLDLQSWTVNIVGHEAIGAIRVNLEGFCFAGTWVDLADDWAYLRNGIGTITADKQTAVGEKVKVTWQIPYITAEGGAGAEGQGITGFFLIGNHLDTGKEIVNMKLESLQGTFDDYTVLPEDFVPGTAGDCADNIIRWRLLNELWNVDWRDTTTIDVAGASPVVTNLKWDKSNYITGDTATLTWDVELGPEGFPIDSQKVVWGFQEPIQEVDLNATERTFTTQGLGQAGEVQGEVIAYDTACRPSVVANTFASVSDPNQPPTPPGGEESNLLVIAIAATIAILLAILVVFLLNPLIPGPTVARVIVLIIIGILVALALFFLFQAIGTAIANAFMIGGMK